MTREEAIKQIEVLRTCMIVDDAEPNIIEALNMAVEALEQVHCDDCIRRSDIGLTDFEMVMCNGDYKEALKMLLDKIEKAPSVTPAEKVGNWINHKDEHQCSQCREIVIADKDIWEEYPYDYCPNCGSFNGGEQNGSTSGTENP